MSGEREVRQDMLHERPVSRFCVYTIRHTNDLDAAYRQGGDGAFTENTTWKTGRALFLEAQRHREAMPVIFASAEGTDRLIYYAMLSDVRIEETDPDAATTTYRFTGLTPIEQHLPLRSLTLRSTGRPLSDNYIRPYSICFTPDFLLRPRR